MTTNETTLHRRCLILVAHGSRRVESNEEVANLARKLSPGLQDEFDTVMHAFLEIAQPSIPQVIDDAVQNGFRTIVALPYFLAAGTHVVNDIPAIVAEKQTQYPGVQIRLTPYFGSDERVVDILAALSREAGPL